eukprot:Skav205224  [mRNA]  locus=scaffold400:293675:317383:- [translate_table: standard]
MGSTTQYHAVPSEMQDPGETIVPDQDPLLKQSFPLTRRIVHADITRDFDIKPQVLGTGYSGAVRLAEHKTTRQRVAVKQFSKHGLKPHRLKLLKTEVEVYLRLDHPNICRLLYAYESKRDDRLKLIDFGFSEILASDDTMLHMPCGTLHYTSPEVLNRNYTSKCDLWSLRPQTGAGDWGRLGGGENGWGLSGGWRENLGTNLSALGLKPPAICGVLRWGWQSMGVICYMLLVGRPPFRGSTNAKIARAIMDVDFQKTGGRWEQLSPDAQDFVVKLLEKDVSKRMSASEALEHPWLKMGFGNDSPEIGSNVLKSLRTFAQGSHLRRAALMVLAYSLTSSELEGLEQTFLDFDCSKRGTITQDRRNPRATLPESYPRHQVARIFHSFDFAQSGQEIQYTPFVAALLETRVAQYEDKVRAAFEAFDVDGKGFITADSLVRGFNRVARGSQVEGTVQPWELSTEEAERWIKEVDFKGQNLEIQGLRGLEMGWRNGVVNYTCFVAALMGKSLRGVNGLPSSEDLADQPTLRMFDDSPDGGRPRGFTESFASTATCSTMQRPQADGDVLDTDSDGREREEPLQSGHAIWQSLHQRLSLNGTAVTDSPSVCRLAAQRVYEQRTQRTLTKGLRASTINAPQQLMGYCTMQDRVSVPDWGFDPGFWGVPPIVANLTGEGTTSSVSTIPTSAFARTDDEGVKGCEGGEFLHGEFRISVFFMGLVGPETCFFGLETCWR